MKTHQDKDPTKAWSHETVRPTSWCDFIYVKCSLQMSVCCNVWLSPPLFAGLSALLTKCGAQNSHAPPACCLPTLICSAVTFAEFPHSCTLLFLWQIVWCAASQWGGQSQDEHTQTFTFWLVFWLSVLIKKNLKAHISSLRGGSLSKPATL